MVTRSCFLLLLLAAYTLAATLQRVPINSRNKRYSIQDPCRPSPCGPNAQCEIRNGSYAVCSCLPGFLGAPPSCHIKCEKNVDCGSKNHCINCECRDPCSDTCGNGAHCDVIDHNRICSCPPETTGDPFIRCSTIPSVATNVSHTIPNSPCDPTPCGPNSNCEITEGTTPICKCLPNYVGTPPSCRPESGPCVLSADCASQYACINSECRDPCPGACGIGALCETRQHNPVCSCPEGIAGDPFVRCRDSPPVATIDSRDKRYSNPCQPSPCGPNSKCENRDGSALCSCLLGFLGTPPCCHIPCELNVDCDGKYACIQNECRNPCPDVCGEGADCDVTKHIPICSCPPGKTGDPFIQCTAVPSVATNVSHTIPNSPCDPNPCGPNSNCEITEGTTPICKCLPNYVGTPPSCRPESGPSCVLSADCASQYACISSECRDPCRGTCGLGARCEVSHHNPVCSCPEGIAGDPFVRCRDSPPVATNPESLSRERRQYFGGQYSGSNSFSGVNGGVPYGGGSYSLGTLGPQGFVGYTGNFGNPYPNFVTPNLFPAVPYIANNPFDISSLYNAYFNALQAQQQNLQNQLIQLSDAAPQLSSRQITLGPARPPAITLPGALQPGSGQIGQLVTNYQQTLRGALCRALQRLQVTWAQTASVCSNLASAGNQGGGGLLAINTANSRPGGASIAISAPPDAQIQPITGVQSGSQGYLTLSSGSSKPGAASISIIAPSTEEHQIQEISEGLGTRGQGMVTITKTGGTRPKGGATITISAPSHAQIQEIKGPDGNVQGVTVTHQGPDNGGNYVGSFSSSSSSSTNVNGETQSQQSSTLGINNNGLTTFISSHSR